MNLLPQIGEGEDKSSPFLNCLRNKYRHIRKWAKRTETNCFRLYDREIPHFPLAIDFYAGRFCVHYFSPSKDNDEPSDTLKQTTEQSLNALFGAVPKDIFWRTRAKTKTTRQYEKMSDEKDFFTAQEYGVPFWINLVDYLDTGLFLDHRETRHHVAGLAKGKRLLNLFSYTASFSIHAAVAGASFTKSVDMSNTYSNWAKENFLLNNLSLDSNEVVREDCLKFLGAEYRTGARYDIIVIDPPTISRSKKMAEMFDIQQDYIFLLEKSIKLLNPNGKIFFSTNSRKFILDESLFKNVKIEEISDKTIPLDFAGTKIHRCWKISSL